MIIENCTVCTGCGDVKRDFEWKECPNKKCNGHFLTATGKECCQGCYLCVCGALATCGDCDKCDVCCECGNGKERK